MQVSVQTDRKKKELAPVIPPVGTAGGEAEGEDEREKQRRIKKLTLINRQLIETLKRQNEQLTKKINRQKLRVGRSVQRAESPGRNMQKEKKELANAYKQIEMYKNVLKDLKAKEISTESAEKLSQLENRIRCEDGTIDKLQKELRYVRNIRDQQQKELHLYENQDVKASVGELEDELKQLKEKLKQAKKQAKKREEVAMKQHAYFIQLEKTLRKHNDEYYPGLTSRTKKEKPAQDGGDQITEREWQVIRAQLAELKKTHEENNRKIETLTRLRNKELKSFEENELRTKDKQRRLATLKAKLSQLAKLVVTEDPQASRAQKTIVEAGQGESGYEQVLQNGKKVFKPKDSSMQRQVKRWVIPQGYVQEKGKILPDSTFFSDKSELRSTRKSKIVKVHVWTDAAGWPSLCQFFYRSEEERIVAGIIPFALGELQSLEDRFIQYKQGDYLAKIQGKIHDGIITSLTFHSKFGKKETFNPIALGEDWRFEPRPNEIPTCMFGSTIRDANDRIRLCYIGCEFIEDW